MVGLSRNNNPELQDRCYQLGLLVFERQQCFQDFILKNYQSPILGDLSQQELEELFNWLSNAVKSRMQII